MSSEHQKETAFLRRCILYEEGNEGRQLDERIAQIQRDERSLHRATWFMSLLATLAVTGFAYIVFLLEDLPNHMSLFAAQFITKTVCALGIGSFISLLAFGFLGIRYRRDLNLRREDCRELVTTLLERRPGKLPVSQCNGELKKPQHDQAPQPSGPAGNDQPESAPRAIVVVASTNG